MTKKNVRPVQSKNTYGLVRMDRTAKMYQELQKKEEEKTPPRPLWRSDYAK
jgi:hypothetical protein